MKIDASQEMYETVQAAQMDVWIDLERVREFDDTTQKGMIQFKHESIYIQCESIHTKSETFLRRFKYSVNRFIQSQNFFWDDTNTNESIHADTRHKWKGTNMDSYRFLH